MKTKQAFCGAVLVAGFFFSSAFFLSAQSRVWNQRPGWTNSFLHDAALANLPGAVQVLTNILTSPVPTQVVTTQSFARMPAGLYWSLQGLTNHSAGPLPGSPFGTNVPVYALSSNQFVFDDRGVNYAAMTAAQGAEATNDFPGQNNAPGFDSLSALWLSIPPDGLNETNLTVMVHNTASGLAYTLLTKPDLTAPSWNEEQLFYGSSSDVTQVEVTRNARTNLFVWARSGAPSGLTILQQPLDQDVLEADTVTFSVLAAGNGTLSYQWRLNGTNIFGATANNYTINNVQLGDAAGYSVRVSDGTNFISSRTAQLTVELGTGVPWLTIILGQRQEYTFQDGVT